MSAEPLKSLGYWSGREVAFEGAVPITIAGYSFWKLKGLMAAPAMGKPLTSIELIVMLGALTAVVSWAVSRQLFLFGRRSPVTISFFTVVISVAAVYGLGRLSQSGFESFCSAELSGKIVMTQAFLGAKPDMVCQIGGIPGSSYVPGTLIRPSWPGLMSVPMVIYFVIISLIASVALRDKRLAPTKIVRRLYKLLEYAPAAGPEGVLGEKSPGGKVQACTNSTFWGEICGQLYAENRKFEPGEWCGRCNQTYMRAERELTFNLVTLFSDNIDLLNVLEKKDTLSWDINSKIPPDGRQSGVERWVILGQMTVPDVISVSQLLSLAHAALPTFQSDDERVKSAISIAQKRASKLFGWIWFGRQTKRLTYARPTTKVLMAIGTTRLRDLITDSGEELSLQFDIGLLPVEMRTAFLMSFLDKNKAPRFQNSKCDVWVPVAPKLNKDLAGLWVPRIEGTAFRKWLSTGHLEKEGKLGATVPRPYQVYVSKHREQEEEVSVQDEVDEDAIPEQPEEEAAFDLTDMFEEITDEEDPDEATAEVEPEPDPTEEEAPPEPTQEEIDYSKEISAITVKPGTLDIVRAPFTYDQTEPRLSAVQIEDSIAEWEWFEPEQIQLLRKQCLVLVDMTKLNT